jgi:hypothetical protein
MPEPNPTSLLDTQRLIIPYARPPRSLHLHQRDWRVRCPDVRSASEGSSPSRRQSAPRLMCRTLLPSTFASLSWDNDWKPPRHMLDDWNIQMMERDRRLTGSKRGQRVRVLFARAGPGSRQAAGRRAAAPVAPHPLRPRQCQPSRRTLSLSLSSTFCINLRLSSGLACSTQDDPIAPDSFATNSIWDLKTHRA